MISQMFSDNKNLSREWLCEKTGLSDTTAKREIIFLNYCCPLKLQWTKNLPEAL